MHIFVVEVFNDDLIGGVLDDIQVLEIDVANTLKGLEVFAFKDTKTKIALEEYAKKLMFINEYSLN